MSRLISTDGVIPLGRSQDVVGPLARTVTDLAIGLDAITGSGPAPASVVSGPGSVGPSPSGVVDAPIPRAVDAPIPRAIDAPIPRFADALRPDALEGARIGVLDFFLGRYRRAMARREALREAVLRLMEEEDLDALAYPTMRREPAPLGGPQNGSTCHLSAATGFPALALPAGFDAEGLPVGFELLGRPMDEPA